jgi:O-antigen/teichoic acid export membrane protein
MTPSPVGAFVRDSLGTALSQYVARFALMMRGVVAAAALGPMGFGGWNALNLLLDYGSYASAGALQGLDLDLPPAAARADRARADQVMAGAWALVLMGGGLFALAMVACLSAGVGLGVMPWGWGPPLLMLAAVILQLAIQYHSGALRAHGEFQTVSAAQAAQAVLGGGLGLALVTSLGVWGLLWGWLAGSGVALLWLRRGPVRPPLKLGSLGLGLELARRGLPVFGLYAASLVLRSVDRIACVRYVGAEGLGHYSIGLMAAGLVLYLPEAAAAVLYPRMSAAAQGARDPERTRAELKQAHRALAVVLPPAVACGMVWAGPAVTWLLPAFREGVPALRVLALGALILSGATLPSYFVLASGPRGRMLAMGAAMALLTAALVFSVAMRDPRPAAVALAECAGYAGFAAGIVALAAPRLCATAGERLGFAALSFVPALWAGGLALASCAVGGPDSAALAALRSLAVLTAYAPVLWWFGRGAGLGRLARAWLAGPVARS